MTKGEIVILLSELSSLPNTSELELLENRMREFERDRGLPAHATGWFFRHDDGEKIKYFISGHDDPEYVKSKTAELKKFYNKNSTV